MWYSAEEFVSDVISELNLKFIDVVIIRKLIDIYTYKDANYLYSEGKLYIGTNYNKLAESLKIQGISEANVINFLNSYRDMGLIETIMDYQHDSVFYTFTDKIESLVRL